MTTTPREVPRSTSQKTWRPDIQGLRALAVLLVVVAHVGTPGFEGGYIGVDVFFVISGFLITQLLLREADTTGTVSISQFYIRRARRILPAATVVTLLVIAYATFAFPLARLHEATADAAWSSVFLANWHFALSGTDYFSAAAPSIFQHYWSLAVEEQFYLIWPLLVLLFVPRIGRRGFAIVAGIVFAVSLVYSVWSTAVLPEATYFNTAARAFELAGGALLACMLTEPLSSRWRHGSGILGIVLIGYATFGFTELTPFPGWQALVPVVGTALLLAAGPSTLTGRALSWGPARYIGDISFSLYLWHWPVALAFEAAVPDATPFFVTAPPAILVSVALAALTFHVVEKPFQEKRIRLIVPGRRTLWLWPVSVVVVLAIAFGTSAYGDARQRIQQQVAQEYFDEHGYQDVSPEDVEDADDVQDKLDEAIDVAESGAPIPPDVDSDKLREAMWTDIADSECYASDTEAEAEVCEYGDADGDQTIALVGDSHAAMWLPALDIIGADHGFRVVMFAKMACGAYPVVQDTDGHDQPACDDFRDFTRDQLVELKPDAIILGARGQLNMKDRDGQTVDEQWEEAVHSLVADHTTLTDRVIALGDVPARPDAKPKDCVEAPGTDQSDCVVSGESIEQHSNTITKAAAEAEGATYVDTETFVCTDDGCPLFAGEVPLYEDDSHLNRLWVELLAPALDRELENALP